jgi:hypothetical protein
MKLPKKRFRPEYLEKLKKIDVVKFISRAELERELESIS